MSSGMSCAGVQEDTYSVSVQFSETRAARGRWLWIRYGPRCCICFTVIAAIALVVSLAVTPNFCYKAPEIALEDFAIRDMALFHNVTTNSTPWQATSDIKVTLAMRNHNTVARCFTTVRQMKVFVYYQTSLVWQTDISLLSGFALKPRSSSAVAAELKGELFQMESEVGAALEEDLRSGSVPFVMEIDTRFLIADRRSFWTYQGYELVASTPLNSNSGQGAFLSGACLEGVIVVIT